MFSWLRNSSKGKKGDEGGSESRKSEEESKKKNVEDPRKIRLKQQFDDRKKELDSIFLLDNRDLLCASLLGIAEPQGNGMVMGPNEDGNLHLESQHVAAICFSTYPMNGTQRMGDPISDCFSFETFGHSSAIISLADGCGWGLKSREAARLATTGFQEYMKKKITKIDTVRKAAHYLIKAFAHAHIKIINSTNDLWSVGTTTLLGGILLTLSGEAAQQFRASCVLVCASVGDCKAFRYNAKTRNVSEITNRPTSLLNPADPGGRLGPYIDNEGSADLRNLDLFVVLCNANDLIMCFSDGIHDNYDPQLLGLSTRELGLSAADWESADMEEIERTSNAYRNKLLAEQITIAMAISGSGGEISEKNHDENGHKVTILQNTNDTNNNNNNNSPSTSKDKGKGKAIDDNEDDKSPCELNLEAFVRVLETHTQQTTSFSRNWLGQHAGPLPDNKKNNSFQGKMDHSTALVVRVGWH